MNFRSFFKLWQLSVKNSVSLMDVVTKQFKKVLYLKVEAEWVMILLSLI